MGSRDVGICSAASRHDLGGQGCAAGASAGARHELAAPLGPARSVLLFQLLQDCAVMAPAAHLPPAPPQPAAELGAGPAQQLAPSSSRDQSQCMGDAGACPSALHQPRGLCLLRSSCCTGEGRRLLSLLQPSSSCPCPHSLRPGDLSRGYRAQDRARQAGTCSLQGHVYSLPLVLIEV